jgi:hypothetical protein
MLVYCIVCYLVVLGMIIENYHKKSVPIDVYFIFALSPILLPIFIGMMLTEKSKNNE